MSVREIIRYNLRGLLNFSGRDPRRVFWIYFGSIFALTIVLYSLATIPLFIRLIFAAKAAATIPIDTANTPDPIFHFAEMLLWVTGAVAALMIFLVAAAVTRRLHDIGRAGKWALIPVILLFIGLSGMYRSQIIEQDPGAYLALILLANMTYNLTLIILVIFLCLPSSLQENRFGKPTNSAGPQRT